MDSETWMNAKMALELGFCDEVLYQPDKMDQPENSFTFSRRAVTNCLLGKMKAAIPEQPPDHPPDIPPVPIPEKPPVPEANKRVNASALEQRLARFLYL